MAKKKIKYPYNYSREKRRKAKIYTRAKIVSGLVNGLLIPAVFLLAFFFSGGPFFLKGLVSGFLAVPAFIFLLLTLLNTVTFPLGFYSGYVYEHKYGLSRQTKRAWMKDYLKGLLMGYLFGVPVLTAVYFLLDLEYWWIYAGILYFFLDVFLDTVYPVLILPFFYRIRPFKNRMLKRKLLEMARRAGAKNIRNVVVAQESEKSVKANAMFAGIGKTKKIILFDTLLDSFTDEEVETVIGHELGHYVNRDIWKGIALDTVTVFPVFFIIHFVLLLTPGLSGISDIAGLPVFLAVFDIVGIALMPITNYFSRKWEREADMFGLEAGRNPRAQISTEKRLADLALSDDRPHPFVEWMLYTHPPAEKRIKMVMEWEKKKAQASQPVHPAPPLN
jgi:STE24 endopeptidase